MIRVIRDIRDFITGFPRNMKRACKYFKFMWNNEDFDYSYLLNLEREKLKDMYNYFRDAKWTETEWVHARDCKLAIALLDIILEDDSATEYVMGNAIGKGTFILKKYVNTENMPRFMTPELCKEYAIRSSKKNLDRGELNWLTIMKDELRMEKAWRLYCKLRENNLRDWCD